MTETPPPVRLIPAATLILIRDRPGAAPDLLMMQRAANMVFAANALVFPGGRIDPGDHELAARVDLLVGAAFDLDEAAARIAAIRETIEEVGIAVALEPAPTDDETAAIRRALGEGKSFEGLLDATRFRLRLDVLTLFAWWRPTHLISRNFDTRFYVAAAPEDAVGEVDGSEATRLIWMSAEQVLADAEAGHSHIILPTRSNLQRLAQHADLHAARTDAGSRAVRPITPVVADVDGIAHLRIPDDQGYPIVLHREDEVSRS